MPYELSVSEVGPAEYPLMEVLRETIFSEAGHTSLASLSADLEGRQDVFALIAHLEGNPVGFKVGYRFGPGVYYSKSGGVLKEYRQSGLGRRMQEWQHGWLRARGYRKVFFNSFNHFKPMICLGLASGFGLTGIERQHTGDLSFRFSKDLILPDPPRRPRLSIPARLRVGVAHPEDFSMIAAMASLAGPTVNESQIESEASGAHGLGFIAWLDSKPVGFAIARPTADFTYLTMRLGVVDTYRDCGAEQALAAAVLDEARDSNYAVARWCPALDDSESLLTGLRAGYDLTGIHHPLGGGRTTAILERTLTEGRS